MKLVDAHALVSDTQFQPCAMGIAPRSRWQVLGPTVVQVAGAPVMPHETILLAVADRCTRRKLHEPGINAASSRQTTALDGLLQPTGAVCLCGDELGGHVVCEACSRPRT